MTRKEGLLTVATVIQRSSFPALRKIASLVQSRSPVANAANRVKPTVTPKTALPGACPERAIPKLYQLIRSSQCAVVSLDVVRVDGTSSNSQQFCCWKVYSHRAISFSSFIAFNPGPVMCIISPF